MSETGLTFNRRAVRLHRDRAAAASVDCNFLFAETAERLLDRLDDINRDFPIALDLGCHGGQLASRHAGRGGIETLVQCDLSPVMAARAQAYATTADEEAQAQTYAVAADEEALPFARASLDLILSNLTLHWINDLPGALIQARRALKPDGLFLASMLGGVTLHELRAALCQAETEVEGGLSPRVSPFADVPDLGQLLQRAGFALPVVDTEEITVSYGEPLKLIADLRAMGETNSVTLRRTTLSRRTTLMRAVEIYRQRFADADGRVPATFQVLTMTAWAPAPNQPKPLKPGAATTRLADALSGRPDQK